MAPATDTDPVWSPDGSKIAFVSGREIRYGDSTDANYEIYVMNADGSDVTRLTSTDKTVLDRSPAWSPDGSKIAFWRSRFVNDRLGASNLVVMDADGRNQRLVFNTVASEDGPDWSPDGSRIVFMRDEVLNIVRPDGSGRFNLGIRGRQPIWSPDGRKIGFLDTSSGRFRTVNANGSGSSGDLSRARVYGGLGWQPVSGSTAAN